MNSSRQIGPYKLLQKLGEGGMGAVYVADQLEPAKRRVALKLIKSGMDSKQVVARFEAERQALAMMDRRSEHRQGTGCWHHGRRHAVLRHGTGAGYADHEVL